MDPTAADHFFGQERAGYTVGGPQATARRYASARAQATALQQGHPGASAPATPAAANLAGAPWAPLGPVAATQSFYGFTNSGRVTSEAVVPAGESNAGNMFVGTAGGGVWESSNDGASWSTTTDHVPTGLAIGALAIDPTTGANSNIIYAGTGEDDQCGDCFYGQGVLKSTDSGATWKVENPGGLFTGADFSSIVVDPNNDAHLYAGTTNGLYESSDGGTTWTQPSSTKNGAVTAIALDPAGGVSTIYVAVADLGVEKSTDGGATFSLLSGLPAGGDFEGAGLGIGTKSASHPTADQDLYAAVDTPPGAVNPNGGGLTMYSTTNGGTSWTELNNTPAYTNQSYSYGGSNSGNADQNTYDNALAVDPANPTHVVAVGIAAVETTNGGTSWTNLNGGGYFVQTPNLLHPDFHAVAFEPSGKVLLGCDGGVYEYNPNEAVSAIAPVNPVNLNSNLNTIQFYADLGQAGNGAQILGGAQDNGTQYYTGSSNWPQVISGDGGYSAINPNDTKQQLGEADQTLFLTSDAWATTQVDITPHYVETTNGILSNFTAPMALVPNATSADAPTVYFGGDNLYVTHNLSFSGTGNNATSTTKWTPIIPTGALPGAACVPQGQLGSGCISAIAVDPANPAVVYVGFDNGTLLVSPNVTSVPPTFTNITPRGNTSWITHIAIDPSDATGGTIALSLSSANVQASPIAPMVMIGTTPNIGAMPTYTDISGTPGSGGLPAEVASSSVVYDSGSLVVATDVGVFSVASLNGTNTTWSAAGTGLPNVQVVGLTVTPNGTILAETHGRGIWSLAPTTASPATHFSVSAPVTATTGTPVNVAVSALDASNATVTGYTGTVKLTSSDTTAALPSTYTFTTGDAGTHSFLVTFPTAGSQTVTATDVTTTSITGTSNPVVLSAPPPPPVATHFAVSAPATATTGTPVNVAVSALDASNATVRGYTGTVKLTSSDTTAALPSTYTFTTGDAGTHSFLVTFPTAGSQTVTATDVTTTSITGTSNQVAVSAPASTGGGTGGGGSGGTGGTGGGTGGGTSGGGTTGGGTGSGGTGGTGGTTGGGGGGGGGTTTTTTSGGGSTATTSVGGTNPTSTGQLTSARLAGANRIATAIATSQQAYPTAGTAQTVTLARDDIYPDALAGGPFASAKGGPLLLSESTQLDPATLAEIQRVLPRGGTVYLLGGSGALSDSVSTALTSAGFTPVRLAGSDRFATAVAIANALHPTAVFEASGVNFPDALSAGPAAMVTHGAILLTSGTTQAEETAAYLATHPGDTRYAVGGPAGTADPSATPLVGADRFATSAAVASKFFTAPTVVGIATGLDFPDALAATPLLGSQGAPVLLVSPTGALPSSVGSYLSAHASTERTIQVFGGSSAVGDALLSEVQLAVQLSH